MPISREVGPILGGVAGSGSGTVTSVSVNSANGFSATVSNPTTTPAITIQTTIPGILKGVGSAVVAAVAGVDYDITGGLLYNNEHLN